MIEKTHPSQPISQEQFESLQAKVQIALHSMLEALDNLGLNPQTSLQIDLEIRAIGLS